MRILAMLYLLASFFLLGSGNDSRFKLIHRRWKCTESSEFTFFNVFVFAGTAIDNFPANHWFSWFSKVFDEKKEQKERKEYPNVRHLWPNSGHDVARGNWKVDWNPRSISPRDASPFGRPTPVRVERFTRFRVNRIINEDRAEFQACDATRVLRINRTSSRATATAAFSLRKRRFRAVRQIIAATSICVSAVACLTPEY